MMHETSNLSYSNVTSSIEKTAVCMLLLITYYVEVALCVWFLAKKFVASAKRTNTHGDVVSL